METLTKGYNRKCKDGVGGVQYIALYPFVPYHRFQIITDGETLVSHPTTEIFRFYPVGDISVNENQSEDVGGKFYDQTINFKLQKSEEYNNIMKLLGQDYGIIYQDRRGYYKILGLYNGLECGSINYSSGSGKSDFNGFTLSFTGKEVRNSLFIDDLADAGFVVSGFEFRITEDGEFKITENNDKRIV